MSQRLLEDIRYQESIRAGDRVGVAVSSGIDSVALLRLLLELCQDLGFVLSVVHFNHKLRGNESDVDQEFVAELAREHGLESYCASGDVAGFAAEEHCGVEAAARELRYGFFRRLLGSSEEEPQGLKPESFRLNGAAEAAPLQSLSGAQSLSLTQGLSLAQSLSEAQSLSPAQSLSEAQKMSPADTATARSASLDKIATGHTLDDQGETVLMRLIRGTGLRGLGAIHPRVIVEKEDGEYQGEIVRPLLGIRRRELEHYLAGIKQPWREDSSNADARFTRNRVRKLVVPLLEREFNPAVVESFAELAAIARDEEDYWESEISGWMGTAVQWSEPAWTREVQDESFVQIKGVDGGTKESIPTDSDMRTRIAGAPWLVMNASVSRPWLLTEPRAVQRRVLKAIGEQAGIPLEFKHVEEVMRFAAEGPPGKELSLPLGWKLRREPEAMVFITPDLRRLQENSDYEYLLPVPGRALVPELGGTVEALRITPEIASVSQVAEYNPQQLLRAQFLSGNLTLRNWRAGDRFWPAHTKSPKKIKELLTERHVAHSERRLWPVVVSGKEIVWMRGFPVPSRLLAKAGEEAVLIREMLWAADQDAI